MRFLLAFSFLFTPASLSAQTDARQEEARIEFFERKIRPILAQNCFNCHSADTNSRGGLRVDDRNGLLFGGGRGPAIVPGDPDKSLMIQAVRHTHAKLKMPQGKKLTDQQIADLTTWIKGGAAWTKIAIPKSIGRPSPKYEKLRKEHWAFQPIGKPPVPRVKDGQWARDDIDRFVLAGLEAKGLRPVADADPVTLIRRVTFDLTGLPPTPLEVDAFAKAWRAASAKPQAAYEQVVDRLLASRAFGERWGRHWLDLARYGESTGSARNLPYPHAWRYRDYVIDAFNNDTPYDHFLREQIAGDLLPFKDQRERDNNLVATGFLAIGVRDVNQRFKVRFVMDNIDEQIDTMTRSVLALTVSCARCHDHKFDPIPTTDYYALAGIFYSSDNCGGMRNKMGGGGLDYYDPDMLVRLGGDLEPDAKHLEKVERAKAALENARAELNELANDPTKSVAGPQREKALDAKRKQIRALQAALVQLSDPATLGPVAMGLRDAKTVADTEVRIRGEAEKLGPAVPRGYPTIFKVPGAPKINVKQSGRLELAHWLASAKNPLTARVMANRVWHHLFGQGLVASVDNFGVTGEAPSNPELLDHLANRFINDGWSVKKLIRTLVLTRAYQLGSETNAATMKLDPANRLVWRHSPRRLSAEEIRDAMLFASGKLDRTPIKGSAAMDLKVMEVTNTSALATQLEDEAKKSLRRSVYLPLLRTLTPRPLEVFDFAEQGLVTGSRDTTTVATQALYLLNDPFVRAQAQGIAQRVLAPKKSDDAARIHTAYRLIVSRTPTAQEIERAASYIADYENAAGEEKSAPNPRLTAWSSFCQALLASAEFRYVR